MAAATPKPSRAKRVGIAVVVMSAIAGGALAGAGVKARLYPPAGAIAIAAVLGLAAGGIVLREVLRRRR